MPRLWNKLKRGAVHQASRAYGAFVDGDLPLLRLGDDEFEDLADQHAESLALWAGHLDATLRAAASRKDLFRAKDVRRLPFESRQELRGIWNSILDTTLALDQVKVFHEHFPAVSPVKQLRRHARAFLLSFGAFAAQFANGLRLVKITEDNTAVRTLLDEPDPDHGLPARCFHNLVWNVLHLVDVTKLKAGEEYSESLAPVIRRTRGGLALLERIRRDVDESQAILKRRGVRYFADNALAILKSKLFRAWFPLQKGVAHWMGEVKLKHRGRPLISPAQVRSLARRLEPGDILIERRNWNLSNVGIPGFWPHAAIYVGPPGELASYFQEDLLAEELRRRAPAAWRRHQEAHEDGHPRAVVEALGQGVILNSVETSCGADYVGVIRPRLPRREKAAAVARAFHYIGRPYDYDFDFLTDSALVCSELVYKCYQPGRGHAGIPFKLVSTAGRPMLPPTEMVAQYDRWNGGPLEFVAFLEGVERLGEAAERPEPRFRKSHRRSKWDFKQP